jgi:hypothetical protein
LSLFTIKSGKFEAKEQDNVSEMLAALWREEEMANGKKWSQESRKGFVLFFFAFFPL